MPLAPYTDEAHVFTLEDLDNWEFNGTSLAVIGSPIRHSLSPQMHNRALGEMAQGDARFNDWRYFRFEVPPERLEKALDKFANAKFLGLNLTIPHKVDALRYISSAEADAQLLGAVNTLKLGLTGYHGHNTDGYGIERALREELGIGLQGSKVILMGAGGASRAIAVQCLTQGCSELWIGNRSRARLDELLDVLKQLDASARIHPFDLTNPPANVPRDAVIINATSLGLKPEDPAPMALTNFHPPAAVYDTTYGRHRNALAHAAGAMGLPYANGLSMLIWQGARALEIWSAASVPAEAMRVGALNALGSSHD